jgi:hypothetical protein
MRRGERDDLRIVDDVDGTKIVSASRSPWTAADRSAGAALA